MLMRKLFILFFILISLPGNLFAAVGCTLSNPAEDLKYLFPEMTTYKEELKNFSTLPDGRKLFNDLQARLGSDLDPVYETFETPYTLYLVYKGPALIGIVHGVNVPGRGGVIQIFVATDPQSAEIRNFFFQRLESSAAKALRKKEFREQFNGLTLADWYKHDYYQKDPAAAVSDKLAKIKSPEIDAEGQIDYTASLRGLKKDLILLDFFFYGRRFEPFFEKAQESLKNLNKKEE